MFLMSGRVFGQTNTFPWPNNPPIGIGTTAPANALHLNFSSSGHNDTAFIRLSDSSSSVYAILGLTPYSYPYYSSLSQGEDLIIHEHSQGDIILSNFQSSSLSHLYGAIRMATSPGSYLLPIPAPTAHDLERQTILPNGNIGFDLPPDTTSGLANPLDQIHFGGGTIPPPGYTSPVPGLTMYGGNRFESMMSASGVMFPYDWRYIAFNQYTNHTDSSSARHRRIAPMSSSAIAFAANDATNDGGMIDLHCVPYDSASGLSVDTAHGINLHLMGSKGLELWCDMSQADPYHHLMDCYRPGYLPYGVTRNTNGLFFHHTPVYIGSDAGGSTLVDFQKLANVHPNLGDDTTWMLAVNGSALFKEAWVNSADWPDYVFLPGFKMMSIADFSNFIETNHHLPELPNAKTMSEGIPLGKTEADLTKQVEEMALYIVQLNKEVEALKAEMNDLKNGGK